MTMAEPENTSAKQARGRFKPGVSGNAGGRPRGARNRTTMLVEALIDGEAESITQTAISLAKSGDATLLKALLDRLAPARKERPVAVDLPPLTSPADAPAIAAALLAKAASGELTPGEAAGLAGLLEAYRRQSELADLESRICALEARRP